MRTTIDLPADLMRAAKARAAEHAESLKDLFTRAIARELRLPASNKGSTKVTLPLVGRDEEPRVDVTNSQLEAALADEEAARYRNR